MAQHPKPTSHASKPVQPKPDAEEGGLDEYEQMIFQQYMEDEENELMAHQLQN